MENKERQFLQVKMKLDELRLPTTFPFQCTDLISKLLAMGASSGLPPTYECSNKLQKHSSNDRQIDLETRVKVLGYEIQKTTKENNTLHLENIHLKQDNEMLHKRILLLEGIKINPHENSEANKLVKSAEKELQLKLSKVTKKHNQLLNRVYGEEEGFQKLEKTYVNKNKEQEFNQALPPRKNMTLKDEKRPENVQNYYGQSNKVDGAHLFEKVEELKRKVKAREDEIVRLQQKMNYDGLNINKLIKDFQDRQASGQVQTLNHQVDLLNKQNFKLKEQLKKVKMASGRAEVLRVENQKLREKLEKQKKSVQDGKSQIQKNEVKNKSTVTNLKKEIGQKKVQNQEIEKIVEKMQSQNRHLAIIIKELEGKLDKEENENQNLAEKIQQLEQELATIKNAQEGQKLLLNYEMEDYKKKNIQRQVNDREHSNQVKQLSSMVNKLSDANRKNEQELKLKNQEIDGLKQQVNEHLQVIQSLKNEESNMSSPLHRQLDYTSSHLNEVTQANKIMESNLHKIKLENQHLKKRLQEANIRQQSSFERQHVKLTSEISKLLKINQQLRDELEKSNNNVDIVQSSVLELELAKQELRKQSQLLQFEKTKLNSLELDNEQLLKAIQGSENKLFKAREESKKLIVDYNVQNSKIKYLEEECEKLLQFKKSNISRLQKLDGDILSYTNDLKQATVTNTLLSEQNINLKKQIIKLEDINRQLRLVRAELHDESLLRGDFNNLVGKYETLILMNKNLKQELAHFKVQNEQMVLDRGNFIKQANHLRLLIHELQQRNNQYKQSQELLRKDMKELQKSERKERGFKGLDKDLSSDQLKSKIEEIEESYKQAMKDSEDVILRSKY